MREVADFGRFLAELPLPIGTMLWYATSIISSDGVLLAVVDAWDGVEKEEEGNEVGAVAPGVVGEVKRLAHFTGLWVDSLLTVVRLGVGLSVGEGMGYGGVVEREERVGLVVHRGSGEVAMVAFEDDVEERMDEPSDTSEVRAEGEEGHKGERQKVGSKSMHIGETGDDVVTG